MAGRTDPDTATLPLTWLGGAPFRARPVDVNHRGSRPEGRIYGGSTQMRPSLPVRAFLAVAYICKTRSQFRNFSVSFRFVEGFDVIDMDLRARLAPVGSSAPGFLRQRI